MKSLKIILGIIVASTIVTTVAQRSRRPTKEYTSYRKIPLCSPSDYVRYPTTIREVVAIVQEAIDRGTTVKAFGARHSQTDIICTEGIPIDNNGLKGYRLRRDGTVTLGAGVSLYEATTFLRENGRAFKTTPAYGNITIAGAIGTGAHGSSIKYTSSISSQVVGLTIVDGLGNVRRISSERDLKAFRVHLGLLGIVVDVSLKTEPLYKVKAHNYIVPDSVLTDGTVNRWAVEADQMSIYWFPSLDQVVVANWSIVDVDTPGEAFTYDHVPSTYSTFNLAVSRGLELIQELTTSDCTLASTTGYSLLSTFEIYTESTLVKHTPGFVPIYTEDGTTTQNPAVGFYDSMFAPTCSDDGSGDLQCVWAHGERNSNLTILDNEISFALADLPEFIETVKDILSKAPAYFPFQGILMRFSANSTTYMSTAYGRDTVHFEWYLVNRKDSYEDAAASLAAYQTIMQVAARVFRGNAHWGKCGLVYQNAEMIDLKLDPSARYNFIAAMDKFDPNGVFINNFGRRLKGEGTRVDFDPEVTKCALLDNCFCESDSDCGETQECTEVSGYTFPVCQTVGETTDKIFPYPVTVPNFLEWLTTSVPGIVASTLLAPLCAVERVIPDIPRVPNIPGVPDIPRAEIPRVPNISIPRVPDIPRVEIPTPPRVDIPFTPWSFG